MLDELNYTSLRVLTIKPLYVYEYATARQTFDGRMLNDVYSL